MLYQGIKTKQTNKAQTFLSEWEKMERSGWQAGLKQVQNLAWPIPLDLKL